MEATPKAPQEYHLWKRRLRAPTRDTFAYAKRLREESRKDLFHLSTEQLKLTKKNLTNRCLTKRVGLEGFVSGIQTEQGAFEPRLRTGGWARTCGMAVLATRMPTRRLRRGYAGTRTRIWNQERARVETKQKTITSIPLNTLPLSKLTLATRNAYAKNIY